MVSSSTARLPTAKVASARKVHRPAELGTERDEFLGLLTHELRNPIHALALQLNAIRRLARVNGASQIAERLAACEQALAQYLDRATVLLDLARYDTTNFPVNPQNVEVIALVSGLVERARPEADFHRMVLEFAARPVLYARLDPLLLEQILANLLHNTIKYSRARKVVVHVGQGEVGHFDLSVEDDGTGDRLQGCGLPESLTAERGALPDHGLGLRIADELTQALGGRLLLELAVTGGRRVTSRIPLNRPAFSGEHELRPQRS